MKDYVVYKHTAPNGKVYIGATRNISSRFGANGSGYAKQPFGNAVREFGWDNIRHEIVASGLTKSDAEIMEAKLISDCEATNPDFGYNVLKFGIYCNDKGLSEAAYNRICQLNRSPEHIAACAKASVKRRGKKQSAETVQARLQTMRENGTLGKPCFCYETGEAYETIADAARKTGISAACINDACHKRSATAGGFHWYFSDEQETFKPRLGVRPVTRRVTNVETGEVFASCKDAASHYDVTAAAINYALKHPNAKCAKCHWVYTDGEWRI